MNYLTKSIFWFATILLLLSGCSKESSFGVDEPKKPHKEDVTVVINLKVGDIPVATRAGGELDESVVNNIDIFVFDKNLKLCDWQYGLIENSGASKVSFSAILKASEDSSDKFRIMTIANARESTYKIFGGNDFGGHKGKSYSEIYELLADVVPVQNTLFSKGIPMWGELPNMVLLDDDSSYTMELVRSLVRVDVGTNPDAKIEGEIGIASYKKLDNFSLEKVYFFNSPKQYMLAPKSGNYSFDDKKVICVSLKEPFLKDDSPIEYSDNQRPKTITRDEGVGYAITSHIYGGEADILMGSNGTYGDKNHLERSAIVVAGYYTAPDELPNSSKLSYYRLDFKKGTNSTLLNDLLRNNNYQIVVRSVNGPGSDTPEEAMKKYSVDVEADVIRWTPSEQSASVIDGQNYLSVSKHDIVLGKWRNVDTRVDILTNQEQWSAKIVDSQGDWIKLYDIESGQEESEVSGVSGDELRFGIDEIPDNISKRNAKIRVVAGKMSLDIFVEQTEEDQEFMLKLSEHEMHFSGRKWDETTSEWVEPDAQALKVTYGPTQHKYKIALTSFSGGGVSGLELPSPPESDLAEIEIGIDAIDPNSPDVKDDPFFERSSRLGITVQNIDGTDFITKQMLIHQTFYSLLLTGDADYYMMGHKYTLTIRSNSSWVATLSGDESVFETISKLSGEGVTSASGEKIDIEISKNVEPGTTAYVTFESPNNLFPSQTIAVTAEDFSPNSYVVVPGESIEIPVRKAYRVWALDRDLTTKLENLPGKRTAELVWQDTWEGSKGIISSVDGLTSPANERDATFKVNTNNIAGGGNALVAFKIDDVIYWSWHIWVTDYDPNDVGQQIVVGGKYTMMDRNLGATSNQPPVNNSDVRVRGLRYQLGRKDPWLGERGVTAPTYTQFKTYYDENGDELYVNRDPSPAGVNLAGSINNPMSYYAGTYGNTSWYGAFVSIRNDFWKINDFVKGDFDPCPEGWKIPPEEFYTIGGTPTVATGKSGMIYSGSYFSHSAAISLIGELSYPLNSNYIAIATVPTYYNLQSVGLTGVASRSAYACSARCIKE